LDFTAGGSLTKTAGGSFSDFWGKIGIKESVRG
jgi:hypothetical protein